MSSIKVNNLLHNHPSSDVQILIYIPLKSGSAIAQKSEAHYKKLVIRISVVMEAPELIRSYDHLLSDPSQRDLHDHHWFLKLRRVNLRR